MTVQIIPADQVNVTLDHIVTAQSAVETNIASLAAALAAAQGQGAAAGAIELYNSAQPQGLVLFAPTPPDQSGGWSLVTVDATGATITLDPQLLVTGNAFARGPGHTIQGRTHVVRYKWQKAGQPDSAVQIFTFVDADTTPAPRAFDRGRQPAAVFSDVWQVRGQDHVDVPIAFVHVDDGSPYFMSRSALIFGQNGSLNLGGGWGTPADAPANNVYAFHNHHNTRRMIRFPLPTPGATGTFVVRVGVGCIVGGVEVAGFSLTVHIVNSPTDIPVGYQPVVYDDDPANFVPKYVEPTATPALDDDLLAPLNLIPFDQAPGPVTNGWIMEQFNLNNGDFVFGVPGSTTLASGRVITADDIFPIVTLPDQRQVRALRMVDCRQDQVVRQISATNALRYNWVAPALRRTIRPLYGMTKLHVTAPRQPGTDEPLHGGDFSPWHYLAGGREHDWNESLSGKITSAHHDDNGGNTFFYEYPDASLFVGEHVRYYHRTKAGNPAYPVDSWQYQYGVETIWVGLPGAEPTFVYQGPNFYGDYSWMHLNILHECPNGASQGDSSLTFDYSQFDVLIHRITSWDTDGTELDPAATYAPVLAEVAPTGVIGDGQPVWTPRLRGGDGTTRHWSIAAPGTGGPSATIDAATGALAFSPGPATATLTGLVLRVQDATYNVTLNLPAILVVKPGALIASDTFARADVPVSSAGLGQTETGGLAYTFPQSDPQTAGISAHAAVFGAGAFPQQLVDAGISFADISVTAEGTDGTPLLVASSDASAALGIIVDSDGNLYARTTDTLVVLSRYTVPMPVSGKRAYRVVVGADHVARFFINRLLAASIQLPDGFAPGTHFGFGINSGSAGAATTRFTDLQLRQVA